MGFEDLDVSTHHLLFLAGLNSRELLKQLDALSKAITLTEKELEGPESRGAAAKYARRIVVNELAAAFQQHAQVDAEDFYSEALCDFIIAACRLGGIALPRSDRVLDLIAPPLKVPRKTP
jgi:hypothetical protein